MPRPSPSPLGRVQINGVEDMLYMRSRRTNSDGNLAITVTFKLGTDLDKARQRTVQNRVSQALPRLPDVVPAPGRHHRQEHRPT
ncbi:efflux RND transporter permease subunit [Cupriavidus basilensis]